MTSVKKVVQLKKVWDDGCLRPFAFWLRVRLVGGLLGHAEIGFDRGVAGEAFGGFFV